MSDESSREAHEWQDGADPEVLPPAVPSAFSVLAGAFEIRPLGDGLLHQSFHVRTGEAEFVLQRVSDVFAPEIQDNIRRVTSHLAARGFATVSLLPTVDGSYSADLGALGRWRLMRHLGGVSFERIQSRAQAGSAGLLVGRFHAALQDFDEPLAPMGLSYRNTPLYLAALREALRAHGDHRLVEEVRPVGESVLAAFDELGTAVPTADRVIHGDLKLQNLLFEGREPPGRDRAFALVDMDTLMRAPLWMELGDAWRSWCNPKGEDAGDAQFDLSIFEASLHGFREGLGRELSEAERRSLVTAPERLTLELCARYVTDTLEERYFGWEASRFATLGDHNLVRARGQWEAFRAACEARDARERILMAAY
jgi:Ser/Thr protein kinase RdoA (MazF antagonist)